MREKGRTLDDRHAARLEANRERCPLAVAVAAVAYDRSRGLDPSSPWTAIWTQAQAAADGGRDLTAHEAALLLRPARRDVHDRKEADQ